MPRMRLDKLLAHLSCGSRKEVQAMIRQRPRAGGRRGADRPRRQGGSGRRRRSRWTAQAQAYRAQRYYMLNKPAGVITASRDDRHETVLGLFPAELRRGLFAVGRLDKDTEGLLIVTDDGALSHALMSPARHVSKVYEAAGRGRARAGRGRALCRRAGPAGRHGVPPGAARGPGAAGGADASVRVTLREGKYHQVKRMIAAVGGTVVQLRRVQLGGLTARPGAARRRVPRADRGRACAAAAARRCSWAKKSPKNFETFCTKMS